MLRAQLRCARKIYDVEGFARLTILCYTLKMFTILISLVPISGSSSTFWVCSVAVVIVKNFTFEKLDNLKELEHPN